VLGPASRTNRFGLLKPPCKLSNQIPESCQRNLPFYRISTPAERHNMLEQQSQIQMPSEVDMNQVAQAAKRQPKPRLKIILKNSNRQAFVHPSSPPSAPETLKLISELIDKIKLSITKQPSLDTLVVSENQLIAEDEVDDAMHELLGTIDSECSNGSYIAMCDSGLSIEHAKLLLDLHTQEPHESFKLDKPKMNKARRTNSKRKTPRGLECDSQGIPAYMIVELQNRERVRIRVGRLEDYMVPESAKTAQTALYPRALTIVSNRHRFFVRVQPSEH